MTDVFTLLTLPKTSNAFTSFAASSSAVSSSSSESGSASPRKTPRLAADSDSASAYRSRRHVHSEGPVVVRVLGQAVKPSTQNGDADFALVTRCVRILLNKGNVDPLPATYEQVYSACRSTICVYDRGEGLFENVKIELERCVGRLSKELVYEDSKGVEWLLPFIETCAWFEKQVALLQPLLAFLDRLYLTERKSLSDLRRLAYDLFAERILESVDVVERLQACIKLWVEWERQNRANHELRRLIPALIKHLQNHCQYEGQFESYYINLTREFYTQESAEYAKRLKDSARGFLKHCEARRTEELKRAQDLLPEETWNQAVDTTDRALLTNRLDWLAKDALGPLLDARSEGNLAKMYMLFERVDGLEVMCAAFKTHVQHTIRKIVNDVEHDEEMMDRLLDFKVFADKLLENAFVTREEPSAASKASTSTAVPENGRNMVFLYALTDAFETGFKARRNKPAEMIAKYLDRAMRKGQKGKKDEDFQAELDAALALYRYTNDKDVFRTFYHRALAKRLLLERSASDDFEKAMLKKLKENYDPEFGMGDRMFNDLALSRDSMREYIEHRERLGDDDDASTHKLSVMVLQRSSWPFAARTHDIDLPPAMQADLTKYVTFYKSKHQGHKLEWDHALGTATLRASFNTGEKELTVSLYQAVVLLLFNEAAELSFAEIKEQTRMEDAELRRTLQSLACGKKRVLRKVPHGKDVDDTDNFHFNADFNDPRYQVHINSIQAKETAEESKRTQNSIEGDRKHALDAAIVRVMKARKELHYEQLKAATIDAVKNHFVPEVSSIKQRIQGLVEQEYLRRDEDDMNLYIYVA
ncbi:hypothetical protein SCP_0312170 [Sparassis crispa]|uniref:Cullin family profile domain-containing protein n=1 Tax=Sparassis crispa TaxID=139825 RepID=A0A401GH48_9APHY|nr:hypothetical protein SCP_0312170 [Sparassis crispa]GBE81488.1 hypothetical protein SCP_0312170 [Sparassis crispa]